MKELEERLIKRITPRIEAKVTNKIARQVIDVIKEEEYPPQSQFKKKFLREVKSAQKRIKEGKGRKFKDINELKKFLTSLR